MNVILCGMPGSGKSHFGVLAAHELGCPFIDTDKLLEKKCQATCPEIMLKGESYFREAERQILFALQPVQNSIIALGGGALSSKEVIDFLRKLGILIYLKTHESKKSLPVYLQNRTFEEVYQERLPIYERACHVIADGENILEIIRENYGK